MRIARVVAEVVAWWAVAVSVWMISLSTAPLQEYLLAVACGLPCGVAAFAARRATRTSWALRPGWLKPRLLAPVAIVTDAVQVFFAVLRPAQPGGRFETVPTGAVDDTPHARSRRALATFFMSLIPAMPETTVQKMINVISIVIIRIYASPNGFMAVAAVGNKHPTITANTTAVSTWTQRLK